MVQKVLTKNAAVLLLERNSVIFHILYFNLVLYNHQGNFFYKLKLDLYSKSSILEFLILVSMKKKAGIFDKVLREFFELL